MVSYLLASLVTLSVFRLLYFTIKGASSSHRSIQNLKGSEQTQVSPKQSYDDNQTPVIRTIPIEEVVPTQTICCKSPDACLPNSTSSVRIVTSQKLPDNGKSLPKSLSTLSNSPFSQGSRFNVQSSVCLCVYIYIDIQLISYRKHFKSLFRK